MRVDCAANCKVFSEAIFDGYLAGEGITYVAMEMRSGGPFGK